MNNCLKRIAPNQFLIRYPLQTGARYVGYFIAGTSLITMICFLVELFLFKKCETCTTPVLHSVYAFNIIAIIYCLCVFFSSVWYIKALKEAKSSVVLCWLVVISMWGTQGACLVFVKIFINIPDLSLYWIVAFIGSLMLYLMFLYCLLIVYAYWLEIRKTFTTMPISVEPES